MPRHLIQVPVCTARSAPPVSGSVLSVVEVLLPEV